MEFINNVIHNRIFISILSFLLGYIAEKSLDRFQKKFSKRKIRNKIVDIIDNRKKKGKYRYGHENVSSIAHGNLFFENNNLTFSSPVYKYHFSMPNNIFEEILSSGVEKKDFIHTNWEQDEEYLGTTDNTFIIEDIQKLLNNRITKEELRSIIEDKKVEVANIFKKKAHEGFFIGELYGIEKITVNRIEDKEKSKVKIGLYRTDYYTHRVMAAVYKELLKKAYISYPKQGTENINDYYPFLTGIGMDVLLLIEDRTKVVLAKRSKQLLNMDKERWHVSMNEAISTTDIGASSINKDACIMRGFDEELGLSPDDIGIHEIYYSDVFFLKDPLEVGILAIVCADNLTSNDIKRRNLTAQDAPFESTGDPETGLKFLKCTEHDIAKFCKENEDNMTSTLKYSLDILRIKINSIEEID